MRYTRSFHLLIIWVLWALGSTLANFDFVPYEFQFTVVKSLDVRRLGTTIPCPNITRQISFTEYLRNKVEGLHLDVDYYVIQYTNTSSGVLVNPSGQSCYQDLGDPDDIIPSKEIHGSCRGVKYSDRVRTKFLLDRKSFTEFCRIQVYRECNQTQYDSHCVPCGSGCSQPNNCYIVGGRCYGKFLCDDPFTDPFCNTTCEEDRYGPTCSETCSENCRPQTLPGARNCSELDGSCLLGCIAGWRGNRCDEICLPGTYGLDCQSKCVGNCLNGDVCLHTDGTCPKGCAEGWKNTHPCDQPCEDNTFGVDCSKTCSQGCVNGTCDIRDGTCLKGCLDGFTGPACSECPKGSYGKNCAFNCEFFCVNGTCDHKIGICPQGQCARGWSGPKCDVDTCLFEYDYGWWDFYTFLVGCGIGVAIALILMITVYLLYRVQRRSKARFMDSPGQPTRINAMQMNAFSQ
ncbi:multiple epidermal growth factor-like domains protein 11 isoform X2 [Ostrea edulis]|uniref:multiple epidermal growth factor-like domains protein 11 isoform X2 n=1 Tax=Ostrea edulis TaxID=37623 RepID=UPI00209552DC|nr:multiple epidermal growth factor-like domains protein 11 isoform X2 [Ostrea edulis]